MKRLKREDLLLLANKLIEKIPAPRNAKEHYQSSIRQKSRKSVRQSEIVTYLPEAFENPNVLDIKSIITGHRKASHTLSKNIKTS